MHIITFTVIFQMLPLFVIMYNVIISNSRHNILFILKGFEVKISKLEKINKDFILECKSA